MTSTAISKKRKKGKQPYELKDIIDELLIFGKRTPVLFFEELSDGQVLGTYHMGTNEIDINCSSSVAQEVQLSTLLHEVIEAILANTDNRIKHSVLSTLECGIYQVLRDNPEFTKRFITMGREDEG